MCIRDSFTRIGASDDLGSGQSTFMVEMNETATILQQATKNSLILMDEVGRGTSTHEGQALAQAIAEHLLYDNQSWVLFATHYFVLTDWAELQSRAKNICVQVKEKNDEVIFLHRIADGRATHSYGVAVAQLAGVPKKVVNRATIIVKNESHHNHKYNSNKSQPDLFDMENNDKKNDKNNGKNHHLLEEQLQNQINEVQMLQMKLEQFQALKNADTWTLQETFLWIQQMKKLID
jgi:DNA mismatch repair protein MutS